MRKQTADGKRAAANDLEKEGDDKAASYAKEKAENPEQRYELGSIAAAKRGFLLALVEWARKRKTFTVAQAIEEFNGRQINSRKVDAARCTRYFNYCRVHGIFKLVKTVGAK